MYPFWVNLCRFEGITAHYLLTSHICFDYMQFPPHVSLYCLFMRTNIHRKHVFAWHIGPKGHRWFPGSLSVIHLNWSHVIRVPFDVRDNRLFLHWHSEAALSEGRVGTLFENLWLTFLTWPEWGNGLNQHFNVLWHHTFDIHLSVKTTVPSQLTDVQSLLSRDGDG